MTGTRRAWTVRTLLLLLAGASLAGCASTGPKYSSGQADIAPRTAQSGPKGYKTGQPYQVGGIWYVPREQPDYDQVGVASWYGEAFNMKATADGEIFDMNVFSAAHTTLPLPSIVEVTNLDNGRKLAVRVNDRGPFVGGRIIDLSHAAAQELGYDRKGLARVRVRYLGPAPLAPPGAGVRMAAAKPAPPIQLGPPAAPAFPAPAIALAEAAPIEAAALVPPPAPVSVASLAPLERTARASEVPPSAVFRIQAGAFGDEANARRAAAQLAAAGTAVIEPIERDGMTLYRVTLAGPAGEAEAFALRERVAGIGFADARVIRPATAF